MNFVPFWTQGKVSGGEGREGRDIDMKIIIIIIIIVICTYYIGKDIMYWNYSIIH